MPREGSGQSNDEGARTGQVALSEEQKRELARKLLEMLRQELQLERDRFGRK